MEVRVHPPPPETPPTPPCELCGPEGAGRVEGGGVGGRHVGHSVPPLLFTWAATAARSAPDRYWVAEDLARPAETVTVVKSRTLGTLITRCCCCIRRLIGQSQHQACCLGRTDPLLLMPDPRYGCYFQPTFFKAKQYNPFPPPPPSIK